MQLFKTEGSSFHARNGALRKRMRKIPQVLRPQVAAPPIPLLCGCYDNQSDMQIETLCVVTMGMCSTEWYKDTDSLMPACVTQDPWCTWIRSRTESPKQNQQQWLSSSSSCHLWKSECHVFTEVMSRVKRLYSNTSLCSALLWCPGFSRSSLISFPPSLSCHVDNTWSGIWGVYAQIKWLFGTSRSILRFAQNDFNLSACWASGSDVTLACLSHWLLLPAPVFHSKATALCSVHPDKYIWAFWLN